MLLINELNFKYFAKCKYLYTLTFIHLLKHFKKIKIVFKKGKTHNIEL